MKIRIDRKDVKARKFVPHNLNRTVMAHKDKRRALQGRKMKHRPQYAV